MKTQQISIIHKIKDKINFVIGIVLLGESIYAIFQGRWTVLFISILSFASIFILQLFIKKIGIYIPSEFQIATAIFIFSTLFLGEIHGYYESFWWWDLILHAGSAIVFGITGFIILFVLNKKRKVETKAFWLAVFSFSFAIAIGVLWEIFEFSMDQIFGFNMQRSGLSDTMWDLIVDAFGALLSSLAGYLYLKGEDKFSFSVIINRFVKHNQHLFKD